MHIERGALLQRFIEQCYEIVTRLQTWTSEPGIDLSAPALAPDAACPVCGTKIAAARHVLCRTCATPHHAECWEYADGCSVFACGERRSRVAPSGAGAGPRRTRP